jgi:hypothetical protein
MLLGPLAAGSDRLEPIACTILNRHQLHLMVLCSPFYLLVVFRNELM